MYIIIIIIIILVDRQANSTGMQLQTI